MINSAAPITKARARVGSIDPFPVNPGEAAESKVGKCARVTEAEPVVVSDPTRARAFVIGETGSTRDDNGTTR